MGETEKTEYGSKRRLAACKFFTTELLKLNGNFALKQEDSFVSLLVLEGEIGVSWGAGELIAAKGGSVFIPAGLEVKITGNAEILLSRV